MKFLRTWQALRHPGIVLLSGLMISTPALAVSIGRMPSASSPTKIQATNKLRSQGLLEKTSKPQIANPSIRALAQAGPKIDVLVLDPAQLGANGSTGTPVFEGTNVAATNGEDANGSNAVVRTNDLNTYEFNYNINDTAADNVTITAKLSNQDGGAFDANWVELPQSCEPTGSSISADKQTLICNLGSKARGTAAAILIVAKVAGTTANDEKLNVEYSISSSTPNASVPPLKKGYYDSSGNPTRLDDIVSAGPKFDLIKEVTRSEVTSSGPGGRTGWYVDYGIYISAGANGKGTTPLASPINFVDTLNAAGSDPSNLSFELLDCIINDGSNGRGPFGKIGIRSDANDKNSVIDSGSIACTQPLGPGNPVNVSITAADTSANTTPITSVWGSGIPHRDVFSGILRTFVPASEILAPSLLPGATGDGDATQKNEYSALTTKSADGSQTNVEPSLTNNKAEVYLYASPGSFYKYLLKKPGTPFLAGHVGGAFDGAVAPNELFTIRLDASNASSPLPGTNWLSCDGIDTSKYALATATAENSDGYWMGVGDVFRRVRYDGPVASQDPTGSVIEVSEKPLPAVPDRDGRPSGDAIRGAAPYYDVAKPNTWGFTCEDSDGPWRDITQLTPSANGTYPTVTRVRVKYDTFAAGSSRYTGISVKANANLPGGTVISNWASGKHQSGVYVAHGYWEATVMSLVTRIAKTTIPVGQSTAEPGRNITYSLKPSANEILTSGGPLTEPLTITDTLPNGLVYVPGSASVTPQSVTVNPDGSTTIVWSLANVQPNQDIPAVTFKARMGLNVTNGGTLTNVASISHPKDGTPEAIRRSEYSVTVTAPGALAVIKETSTPYINPNGTSDFTMTYANLGSTAFGSTDFIDILPYSSDPNASNYQGTQGLNSISGTHGETFEVTNAAPNTILTDPKCASNGGPAGVAGCDDTKPVISWVAIGSIPNSSVTAVRIKGGAFNPGEGPRSVNLKLDTNGNNRLNKYVNAFGGRSNISALPANSNEVPVIVALGSITGTVFNDLNNDGIQQPGEPGIAGVTMKLSGKKADGTPVTQEVTTDANGKYVFRDLFASDAAGYSVTEVQPTQFDNGIPVDGKAYLDRNQNDLLDANESAATRGTATNTVASGIVLAVAENGTAYNFPEIQVRLSGKVWDDADGSKILETGENATNAGGLTVYAYDASGKIVSKATVAADGTYTLGVRANTNYTLRLSSDASKNIGDAPPAASLPAGWVNTGDNQNGTISTGTPGEISANVGTSDVINQDFGIEQPPVTVDKAQATQPNPLGSLSVPVTSSLFNTPDLDGKVAKYTLISFPTNATSITVGANTYTSSTWPGPVVIPAAADGSFPANLLLDPVDGTTTVSIPFTATDNAGKTSNTSNVTLPFTTISVAGKVWNDVDGNQATNNAEPNVTLGLNAVMTDSSGAVIGVVPIKPDGTYLFDPVPANKDVNVLITTASPALGDNVTSSVLPVGWINTTPTTLSFNTGASNTINKDFGLEQPPTALGKVAPVLSNPSGTVLADVPSSIFTGSDPDGKVKRYTLTTFPGNATSITINGANYTSATWPAAGVDVTANPDGSFPANTIKVDPIDGSVTVTMPFTTTDDAGKISAPSTASQPFVSINLSGKVWNDIDGNQALNNAEAVTNAGGLNAVLTDSSGAVIAVAPIGADGKYSFANVPPNSDLKVLLASTAATPSLGANFTASVLPAGWVHTTGPTLSLNTGVADTINQDFGIEQPPVALGKTAPVLANPTGTNLADVPSSIFTGSDPDGSVKKYTLTTFPGNATSIKIGAVTYTSATWPAAGVDVTANPDGSFPVNTIKVDPIDGSVTVTMPFTTTDNAGKISAPSVANAPFISIAVRGKVWDDGDGDQAFNNGESPTNAGGLNAILTDSSGKVIAVVPVGNDGKYEFRDVPLSTDVKVFYAPANPNVGDTISNSTVPTGWVDTTPTSLAFNTGSADTINKDFGLEQPPTALGTVQANQPNPTGSDNAPIDSSIFGSGDLDGKVTKYTITAIPSDTDSITINGVKYDSSNPIPANGVIINANPDGSMPAGAIVVDPKSGPRTAEIPYLVTDNAGRNSAASSAKAPFDNIVLSGKVWDDADASQTLNNAELTINPGPLFVVMTDANDKVIAVEPVAADGTYFFSGVTPNKAIKLTITTVNPGLGSTSTSGTLPANWINTTNQTISLNTGTQNTLNQDFGLEQLPDTQDKTAAVQPNPNGNTTYPVPALTGTDPEDGALGASDRFKIVTVPNNGKLYYNGNLVNAGDTITAYDPAKLTFDPNDGVTLSSFTVSAIDAAGKEDPSPATVKLPFALKAAPDSDTTPAETPINIPVLANDSSGLTNITGFPTPPANGTVGVNPDGTVKYTPKPGFSGIDNFTYTVCNTDATPVCDTTTVKVTVTPKAVDDAYTTPQNTPKTLPILTNDKGNFDLSTLKILTPVAHGTTVINSDGTVTYKPDPGYSGSDSFKYEICDKTSPTPQCTTAIATITITPNIPPVAQDRLEPRVTNTTTAKLAPLVASDQDGTVVDYKITSLPTPAMGVLYLGDPANGGTPVNLNDVLTPAQIDKLYFKPNPSYSGDAKFTFNATDNQGSVSNVASVTIPVNAPPVAKPDATTTPLDTPVKLPILGNDTDVDGSIDPNSIDLDPSTPALEKTLSVPGKGTFSVQPDGQVLFTPNAGYIGTASIPYTVRDNDGALSNPALMTVTILAGRLEGHVFSDPNGDGIQQPGEPNLVNTTVTITPQGKPAFTVQTDANGNYSTTIQPGPVTAVVTPPANTILTTANQTQNLSVTDGKTTTATAVGYQPLEGQVSGLVWEDLNGDGIKDPNERLFPDVTVTITDSLGKVTTVKTDTNGAYSATVASGSAQIVVKNPDSSKYRITTGNADQSVTVPVNGSVSATPVGLQPLEGSVTGRVFQDINGNGQYDTGEGFENVSVKITDAQGKVFNVTTDAQGVYAQPGVSVGAATVDVDEGTLPAAKPGENGWVQTVGSDPSSVTVQPNTSNNAGDDGYVRPRILISKETPTSVASIGGNVEWRIAVTNAGVNDLRDLEILDQMPVGLIYKKGSSKLISGNTSSDLSDPVIDAKTGQITWKLAGRTLKPGQKFTIQFQSTVTPAVKPGKLENTASATALAGDSTVPVTAKTGTAIASVKIELGVFTNKTVIVGRVYVDNNRDNNFDAKIDRAVPGARVYLTDGRYAVTDAQGRYSLPEVEPGVHAVRLDQSSVPYSPRNVPDDQGSAGTRRVVADQIGGIDNEDFPLEPFAGAVVQNRSTSVVRGPVTLEKGVQQGATGYAIQMTIKIETKIKDLTLTDPLPTGATRGSINLVGIDGKVIEAKLSSDGISILIPGNLEAGTYTLSYVIFTALPPENVVTDPSITYTEVTK